jgi:hypothetical protein
MHLVELQRLGLGKKDVFGTLESCNELLVFLCFDDMMWCIMSDKIDGIILSGRNSEEVVEVTLIWACDYKYTLRVSNQN